MTDAQKALKRIVELLIQQKQNMPDGCDTVALKLDEIHGNYYIMDSENDIFSISVVNSLLGLIQLDESIQYINSYYPEVIYIFFTELSVESPQ